MDGTIGEIRAVAYPFIPQNWAPCDGGRLLISNAQSLFLLIGTTYGGDGKTYFLLPDFRGRVPLHKGQGANLPAYSLGQKGGEIDHTLKLDEMPAHKHTIQSEVHMSAKINCNSTTVDATDEPTDANPSFGFSMYNNEEGTNSMAVAPVDASSHMDTMKAGGSAPHPNMQPFFVLNYVICMFGVYPSRP